MPPLVRVGLAASLLATLAVMTDRPPRAIRVGAAAQPGASATALSALCPRGTLPDGDVCVPVPPREPERGSEPAAPRVRAEHDRIERRPDRPAEYARYRLPLELPRGKSPTDTRFPVERGASVRVVRFEHQEGDAEVLHSGELAGAGKAIVLLHAVRDAAGLRDYLSIFTGLARIEPAVTRGARLREGQVIAAVGDPSASTPPALDWEVRRLRAGIAARSLEPGDFGADARTVACDARNVLLLR